MLENMTRAVCIYCGAMKPDVHVRCSECERAPISDLDFECSLSLSEERLPADKLDEIGRLIREHASGSSLDEKKRVRLLEAITGRTLKTGDPSNQAEQISDKPSTPQEAPRLLDRLFGGLAKIVGGFLLFVVVLGGGAWLFGTHMVSTPDNARVLIDLEQHSYASIPCVVRGTIERELIKNRTDAWNPKTPLVLMDNAEAGTIAEIRRGQQRGEKWQPDRRCRDANGFMQTISLTDRIFGYRSRWTAEGEWRW